MAGDDDFVERAGRLLAIARDEWHRGALREQLGRGAYLVRPQRKLASDARDVLFRERLGHGAHSVRSSTRYSRNAATRV